MFLKLNAYKDWRIKHDTDRKRKTGDSQNY